MPIFYIEIVTDKSKLGNNFVRKLGLMSFISKPFDADELLGRIDNLT